MDAVGSQALWLARQAVERYIERQALLAPPLDPLPLLKGPGAAFVTLRMAGALRGCIGTLGPTRPTLAHEIIANAVAAASTDPRFPPVSPGELARLAYEVDILGELEAVKAQDDLDPDRYGVVVETGGRRGVLLPAIEGVTSAQAQLAIARAKALIRPEEPATLSRFTVTRFREPD